MKYSITPTLDIAAAYYHFGQGFFSVGGAPSAALTGGVGSFVNQPGGAISNAAQAAACAANSAASTGCAGAEDTVGLVLDWRFARHVDVYAGVMWSQVQNGLANGFLNAATANNGITNPLGPNKASNIDPGVGLRYQF